MDTQTRDVARECTHASDEERVTFPDVVMKLMEVGVERYHADLVRAEKIYYMPDGTSERVPCAKLDVAPAKAFSAEGVEAAVRAIQAQKIQYREFCERIAEAGCVGYFVTLAGRRAVYYGRDCENHIEWFPNGK